MDGRSLQELKAWVNLSAENRTYFQQQLDGWIKDIDEEQSHYFNKEEAYIRFKDRINHAQALISNTDLTPTNTFQLRPPKRRVFYKIAGYAAVLILIIGVAYFFNSGGFNGAESGKNMQQSAYVEIKVPAGSTEKFTLPDQSVVWINAGSIFKYPANFSGKTREVFLNGEGYFQIAKDATHPFIVNTSKGNITVTGTTFNVYSYDNKPHFVTALLEGHVHVNTPNGGVINLLPSQKATLKNGALIVSKIGDPDEYKWMEGLICFDNERITEVLENLENSFGQKITIKYLAEPDLLLTGKFRKSDGLDYALKVLSESYGITYQLDTKTNSYIILR